MATKTTVVVQTGTSSWSALRYGHFRWMYLAQFVSAMGTTMQIATVNWHVWQLTRDEFALAMIGLVRVIPIVLLALLGGVVADAWDRRRVMLITQTALLVCSSVLALNTLTGHDSVTLIYAMTALISGLGAFDSPAWSALLPNLVPSNQVANAVRLNVLLWQISAVVGPVIAGVLLGLLGPGGAYAIDALSFVPVVGVLLFLRLPRMETPQKRAISRAALSEGLRFVQSRPLLWATMLLDFFATLFASAITLLPVFATDILRVGEFGYGLLYAAPSVGATIGAIFMAQYGGRIHEQGKVMLAAVALFGLATVVFGLTASFTIALAALAVTGLTDTISMVIRGSLRQLLTPDRLRGRMLSVNMIFYKGGPQLGEFEAGVLARLVGAPLSVVIGGAITVGVVLLMAARVPALREYRELPEPVTE